MFSYGKKGFILKNVFTEKNIFLQRKIQMTMLKNIYLVSEIYFYTKHVCVTNRIQIFLKYIFHYAKKKNC